MGVSLRPEPEKINFLDVGTRPWRLEHTIMFFVVLNVTYNMIENEMCLGHPGKINTVTKTVKQHKTTHQTNQTHDQCSNITKNVLDQIHLFKISYDQHDK